MVIAIKKKFGILIRGIGANRKVFIRNVNNNELYLEETSNGYLSSSNEGDIVLECANFTTSVSEGDVIKIKVYGATEGEVSVTIPSKKTTANVRQTISLSTRFPGGL